MPTTTTVKAVDVVPGDFVYYHPTLNLTGAVITIDPWLVSPSFILGGEVVPESRVSHIHFDGWAAFVDAEDDLVIEVRP